MADAKQRFLDFRRSLPRPPRLEPHTVRARGIDFAVRASPDVPGAVPLLCVNGGLLYGHGILWPALSPLATHRRVVLYDQRGRGATPPPPGARANRVEHDGGDVAALLDALPAVLGAERFDVLAHSWGGGIAMLGASQSLARSPGRVRRLALLNAVGPTGWWLPRLIPDGVARLAGRGDHAEAERLRAFAHEDLSRPDPDLHSRYAQALYPAWFADGRLARLFTPPRSDSVAGAAAAARLRVAGYDWRDAVRAVRVPTLVMHGEEDLLPFAVARELAAELPESHLVPVPEAGHMPFWEHPAPTFARLQEFLAP